MNYYIELNDKRNNHIFNILKDQKRNVYEMDFLTYKPHKGDIIILSPARKLNEKESKVLKGDITVYGGNQEDIIKATLSANKVEYVDMLQSDTFAIKNAKLTAEGVLALVINSTEKSIYNNRVLVLGTGRVGKAIALLLKQVGIDFAFVTYHEQSIAMATLFTDKVYLKKEIIKDIQNYDIIINTVPAVVLQDDMLPAINDNCIIMEVASKSCLNKSQLLKYNFKYILAQGLPKVYSAYSAGKIVLDYVTANEQLKNNINGEKL